MSTGTKSDLCTYSTIIGATLVAVRTRAELRQQDLAAIVGVTTMTWSRFERGETDIALVQLLAVAAEMYMPHSFVLDVAEDVAQRLRKRRGVEIIHLRGQLTPEVVEMSNLLGVADIADDVEAVLAKGKHNDEFLARGFRRLLTEGEGPKFTVGEALREALSIAPGIGQKVLPKSSAKKRK